MISSTVGWLTLILSPLVGLRSTMFRSNRLPFIILPVIIMDASRFAASAIWFYDTIWSKRIQIQSKCWYFRLLLIRWWSFFNIPYAYMHMCCVKEALWTREKKPDYCDDFFLSYVERCMCAIQHLFVDQFSLWAWYWQATRNYNCSIIKHCDKNKSTMGGRGVCIHIHFPSHLHTFMMGYYSI